MNKEEILKQAVEVFGVQPQIEMMIEEASELIQALQKLKRVGNRDEKLDNVYEEIADCKLVLEQMENIFGKENIKAKEDYKLERLAFRIKQKVL